VEGPVIREIGVLVYRYGSVLDDLSGQDPSYNDVVIGMGMEDPEGAAASAEWPLMETGSLSL